MVYSLCSSLTCLPLHICTFHLPNNTLERLSTAPSLPENSPLTPPSIQALTTVADETTSFPTSAVPDLSGFEERLNLTMSGEDDNALTTTDVYIGFSLAVSSTIFIGTSSIVKKKALIKISTYAKRAGDGGHAYLGEPLWWAGFGLLAFGEIFNFVAYAFAPALLVTPLGALSVLVTAVLSAIFLKEHLNLLCKIGCLQCVLGSTVMVLHAPKEGDGANSLDELAVRLGDPVFVMFTLMVIGCSLILIFIYSPKYGQTNMLVYITICALIGSLSVLACKGFGIAMKEFFQGESSFRNPLTYFLIFSLVICISVNMHYLNKALDTFNAAVISPIYYVFFTTCVVTASAILFQEWGNMNAVDCLATLAGFGTIVAGIFLLHAFKDKCISLSDLPSIARAPPGYALASPNHVHLNAVESQQGSESEEI
ncbi:magnesium transporter NIPA2-like isoform X1 [Apostichopus japonicus]|uniref:magnesium transporter NIPA2-like isoform X1 n=2 Tax=Stichopus japonicus TaxID=307972 RepID=UPI003AB8D9F5